MVPVVELSQQDQPCSGPALVAKVGSRSLAIVEPVSIYAAAKGTWSVLLCQEPRLNAELGQNLSSAVAGALDGAHVVPRAPPIRRPRRDLYGLPHASRRVWSQPVNSDSSHPLAPGDIRRRRGKFPSRSSRQRVARDRPLRRLHSGSRMMRSAGSIGAAAATSAARGALADRVGTKSPIAVHDG
jgi:hypothetical protein